MILLFTLKLYQFIRGEEQNQYIKTIDVIYKDKQPFNIFIKYFKKIGWTLAF